MTKRSGLKNQKTTRQGLMVERDLDRRSLIPASKELSITSDRGWGRRAKGVKR